MKTNERKLFAVLCVLSDAWSLSKIESVCWKTTPFSRTIIITLSINLNNSIKSKQRKIIVSNPCCQMINFSILISTPQVQLSGTRYSINTLSIVDIIRLDTQPFTPLIGFSQISRQRKLVHDSTTFHSRSTYTTQRMLERDRTLGNAVQATGYTMVI